MGQMTEQKLLVLNFQHESGREKNLNSDEDLGELNNYVTKAAMTVFHHLLNFPFISSIPF